MATINFRSLDRVNEGGHIFATSLVAEIEVQLGEEFEVPELDKYTQVVVPAHGAKYTKDVRHFLVYSMGTEHGSFTACPGDKFRLEAGNLRRV